MIVQMEALVVNQVLPFLQQDESHSLDHFRRVCDHALLAVKDEPLENWQKEAIVAAAYLHDLDDPKISKGIKPPEHDLWADYVITQLELPHGDIILQMIDLVSCSKWGDHRDETLPSWYYIPRYCDRLGYNEPVVTAHSC